MRLCKNCGQSNYLIFTSNVVSCPHCNINSEATNELFLALGVESKVVYANKLDSVVSKVYVVSYQSQLMAVIEQYMAGILYLDPKPSPSADLLSILQKGVYEAWGVLMLHDGNQILAYKPPV
jgi:hypothetical protein